MIARLLGFTFAVKLMENGEENAQSEYELLAKEVEESVKIRQQEEEHEAALLGMLDEEILQYVGSMVLGLNDALVELTGSLAGFTHRLCGFGGIDGLSGIHLVHGGRADGSDCSALRRGNLAAGRTVFCRFHCSSAVPAAAEQKTAQKEEGRNQRRQQHR